MLFLIVLSKILNTSDKNHLGEWYQLAEDEPVVNQLRGRGGGRLSILLMKMVVITNMVVRLTLREASK